MDALPSLNTIYSHIPPAHKTLVWISTIIVIYCLTFGPLFIYTRRKQRPTTFPGVSLLRPLKGVDKDLEKNLVSSFEQAYPNYEILFSVQDPDDSCIPLVERLQSVYSHVPSRLIIGGGIGLNPKVANLVPAYDLARHDILWILDSNIRVDPSTLASAVAIFANKKVGLVHHIPVGINASSLGGYLDALYLNSVHARMYSAANALEIMSMVIGKSNIYRKSVLERAGGLPQFAKYMAEDNEIGKAIMALGYAHVIAPELVFQSIGAITVADFMQRRIRWIRIRKYTVLLPTLYEPFCDAFMHIGLSGCVVAPALGIPLLTWVAWNLALWFMSDLLTLLAGYSPTHHTIVDVTIMACLWPLREAMAFLVWIIGMAGSRVLWRGQYYRCNADGTGTALQSQRIQESKQVDSNSTSNNTSSSTGSSSSVSSSLRKDSKMDASVKIGSSRG